MSTVVVTNALLKAMARSIRKEAVDEVTGNLRSVTLKNVQFSPTIVFIEDMTSGGTLVQAWMHKKKMTSQRYHVGSEQPWSVLDDQFEVGCWKGISKYIYDVLRDNTDLENIIKDLLNKGNGSVKLPNGQSLRSQVNHGHNTRVVSITQKDGYNVCSLNCNTEIEDVAFILTNVIYHWHDPARIYPDDHSIQLDSEWFGEHSLNLVV